MKSKTDKAQNRIKRSMDKDSMQIISKMCDDFRSHLVAMDIPELESVIRVCVGFNDRNCGWLAYYSKDLIIRLAQDRIRDITPESQKL